MILTIPHRYKDQQNLWLGLATWSRISYDKPDHIVAIPIDVLSYGDNMRHTLPDYLREPHDSTLVYVVDCKVLLDYTSRDWIDVEGRPYQRHPDVLDVDDSFYIRLHDSDLNPGLDDQAIRRLVMSQLKAYSNPGPSPTELQKRLSNLYRQGVAVMAELGELDDISA